MSLASREVRGLRLSIPGGNEGIVIHPGRCRDIDDQREIGIANGETCRIDPNRIGLGGLDTGMVQPRTSYAVYLVRQGNDTEGMISRAFDPASADAPAFPNDGSLAYRRIGAIATDANGLLVAADQEGEAMDRKYRFQPEPSTLAVLRQGEAVEFTAFDLAPFFHRHARWALISVQPGNGVPVTIARDLNGTGSTVIETETTLSFDATDGDSPTIGYYRNARPGGSATIVVLGFEETL